MSALEGNVTRGLTSQEGQLVHEDGETLLLEAQVWGMFLLGLPPFLTMEWDASFH